MGLAVMALRPPPPSVGGHLLAEDVSYGAAPLQVVDIHAPPEGAPHPTLILVHGGRWQSGDKEELRQLSDQFAARGFLAINMNYRLTRHPDQVNDVASVIAWARDHAASYGGDPTRVGLLGTSAGGHLALLEAARGMSVEAVASWSGPTDLVTLASEREAIEDFLGCNLALRTCRSLAREASPRTYVTAGDPPTFLANGTEEIIPGDQAERMASALAAAGVPHKLLLVEGDRHGRGLSRWALDPTAEFLEAELGQVR